MEKKKVLYILGSSRSNGNTFKAVNYLRSKLEGDFIDLNDFSIAYYDYEYKNVEDDFIPLIKRIVRDYDTIIFASPIYWYTMSAIMKTFFDRISDCIRTEKDTGRKLRGMQMAALSCSSVKEPTDSFFVPFKLSADYLGMEYLGDVHTWMFDDVNIDKEVLEALDKFAHRVDQKL